MGDEHKTQVMPGRAPGQAFDTDDLATGIVNANKMSKLVGHLTVVQGPGAGKKLDVCAGTNAIGRDPEKNRIVPDFGDTMISRGQHAFVIYDPADRSFALQSNGHANPILLNGSVVEGFKRLQTGDRFQIGETLFELSA